MWTVLELTSHGWRGVVMTSRSVAEIERLRRRQQQLRPRPRIGGYACMRGESAR